MSRLFKNDLSRKVFRNVALFSVSVSLLFLLWQSDISSDKEYQLEVLEPVSLLKEPPQSNPATNDEIGQIHPHEPVKVMRMAYGKDFRAWKVLSSNNQSGWIIENGKNVLLQPNKE
jgi:hypothetical protein